MVTTPWRAASATALGASHHAKGQPNQDAVLVREVAGAVVAAVADGHGGARYVRSQVGSQLAVKIAVELAGPLVGRIASERADRVAGLLRDELARPLVSRWQTAALAHLASAPFTADEEARAGVPLGGQPLFAYGATALVAVMVGERAAVLQLGDGDVVVGLADGRAVAPMSADDRLVGGETTSLCLPTAFDDMRYAVTDGAALVVLATDGYGNAFADDDWRPQVVSDFGRHLAARGHDYVAGQLGTWLTDSASVGGDDTTMALVHRVDGTWPLAPVPAGRRGGPVPAPAATRPAAGPSPRRWSTGWLIGALVAGLAVGGGLGVAVAGGGDDDPAPASTTTSTSVAVTKATVPAVIKEIATTTTRQPTTIATAAIAPTTTAATQGATTAETTTAETTTVETTTVEAAPPTEEAPAVTQGGDPQLPPSGDGAAGSGIAGATGESSSTTE